MKMTISTSSNPPRSMPWAEVRPAWLAGAKTVAHGYMNTISTSNTRNTIATM